MYYWLPLLVISRAGKHTSVRYFKIQQYVILQKNECWIPEFRYQFGIVLFVWRLYQWSSLIIYYSYDLLMIDIQTDPIWHLPMKKTLGNIWVNWFLIRNIVSVLKVLHLPNSLSNEPHVEPCPPKSLNFIHPYLKHLQIFWNEHVVCFIYEIYMRKKSCS